MPKTTPPTEIPADIIPNGLSQPPTAVLGSSTFQLTWPEGEEPPAHTIPSAPQAVLEFAPPPTTQRTPPIVNPFFDPIPMSEVDYVAEANAATPAIEKTPAIEDVPNKDHQPPRFSRAISTPLPAQLKHLRHPSRRDVTEPSAGVVVAAKHPLPPPPLLNATNMGELALELADSVQMVIQTLIQISPPHVLDPAKEQLAGCTLQLPTPSVAALLTTMKNLNYMSANLSSLSSPDGVTPIDDILNEADLHTIQEIKSINMEQLVSDGEEVLATNPTSLALDDFDIGEVLQSVGDVLSGMAAEAGVDLVLFHADVGMKHVNVRGDECGISYALCHVIRQVITTAREHDEIEVGLFISSPDAARLLREESGSSDTASPGSSVDSDDPLMCTLEITHRFASSRSLASPETASSPASSPEVRPQPQFNAGILQNLLRHVRATLQTDVTPTLGPATQSSRTVELSVLLSAGPPISDNSGITEEDIRARQPSYPDLKVASEPTLDDLASFVATDVEDPRGGLKGKRAIFHAYERSSFAHHLTSYLTAWGMDVSHVSTSADGVAAPELLSKPNGDARSLPSLSDGTQSPDASESMRESPLGSKENLARNPSTESGRTETPKSETPAETPRSEGPGSSNASTKSRSHNSDPESQPMAGEGAFVSTGGLTELVGTSFIIIDDDVNVLQKRLTQIRRLAEARMAPTSLPQQIKNLRKRPSLQHRPRSSPSIRLASGAGLSTIPGTIDEGLSENEEIKPVDFDPLQVAVIHFTSLANYKVVQDVIQSTLFPDPSPFSSAYSPADITPDVLVIPKPAGPRRFLTALHTAVRKPYVDPFFAPIATTPLSPSIQYRAGPWGVPTGWSGLPKGASPNTEISSVTSRLSAGRQNSSGSNASNAGSSASGNRLPTLSLGTDRKSPKDHPVEQDRSYSIQAVPLTYSGQSGQLYTPHPPSPLAARDPVEYFSVNSAVSIGDSAGVLVHSPDGRPAGIFFQPQQPRDGRRSTINHDQSENRGVSRGSRSGSYKDQPLMGIDAALASVTPMGSAGAGAVPNKSRANDAAASTSGSPSRMPPPPRKSSISSGDPGRPPIIRASSGRVLVPLNQNNGQRKVTPSPIATPDKPGAPRGPPQIDGAAQLNRTPSYESPKSSPSGTSPGGTLKKVAVSRRSSGEGREKANLASPLKKAKGSADGSIVPPINVLVVEDNPINQTILTTFMKRKKINYGTAKNGQEAVDKWRSGNYHLILMDIQMPVKDGIEATKEIRNLEKDRNVGISPSTPPQDIVESAKATNVPHSPYRSSVIIVALTASSLKSDRVAALAAGCNDFLTKPVSMSWLNTKIIEWGSIKALEMFQDPATARVFSGQNAKTKTIASKLRLPPSRQQTPSPKPAELSPERPTVTIQPPSDSDLSSRLGAMVASPIEGRPDEAPNEVGGLGNLGAELTASPRSTSGEVTGEDALKQHLQLVHEEVEAQEKAPARPVVLGEGAIHSQESSMSIESVIHGIPPIAEDSTPPDATPPPVKIPTPPKPENVEPPPSNGDILPPAIPMAPPSAPPPETTVRFVPNP